MNNTTKDQHTSSAVKTGPTERQIYEKPALVCYGKMKDIVRTGQDALIDDSGMYEGVIGTMS